MTSDKELHSLLDSMPSTQRQRTEWNARLGDGQGNLFVINPDGTRRAGYVWAIVDPLGILVVRCRNVVEQQGWPVRVGRSPIDGILEVIEEDSEQAIHFAGDKGGNVPPHRWSHQFMGSDPDFVDGLRLLPLMTRPTNPASLSVKMGPYHYIFKGESKYLAETTLDLTAEVPSDPGTQIPIIPCLDPVNNTVVYVAGSEVVPFVPGSGIPFTGSSLASIDTSGYWRSVALRLYAGQTEIVWTDFIADTRNWVGSDYYTPGVPNHWHDPDPTSWWEALDDSALRISHLEQYGTGWPPDCSADVTMAFDDGTREFSLTPTSSITYYINGVPYTISDEQTVIIDDTEGVWYIYFEADTLTASQTDWNILDSIALVAELYWDATNNQKISLTYELHSWVMDPTTHRTIHATVGTRYSSGLTASINGDEIDLTGGILFDEDIRVPIVDDDTPDTEWEQALTPLSAPRLYRDGANGDWRIDGTSSTPVIVASNVPQYNVFSGGAWILDDVPVAQYFALWMIATTDPNYPIVVIPGQEVDTTLNNARDGNSLADMSFGNLPVDEWVVIWRILCQRSMASPYYSLEELNDYRFAFQEPGTGFSGTDHGSLTGLLDDDHTQYLLIDGTRAMTGDLGFGAHAARNMNYAEFNELGTPPGTPASGKFYVYAGTDGIIYGKNDTGTVFDLTSGGGGSVDVYENGVETVTEVAILDFKDFTVEDAGSDTAAIYHNLAGIFEARLTTETGVAVSTSDRTAQTEIFLTPYNGNQISLYDGTRQKLHTLSSDISIKLTDDTQTGDTENGSAVIANLTSTAQFIAGMIVSGSGIPVGAVIDSIDSATQITMDQNATADATDVALTFKVPSDTVVDIWVYPDGDNHHLAMTAWASTSARATALTKQDGVWAKTGDTTRRYAGSVQTTDTDGETEISRQFVLTQNAYNRVRHPLNITEQTNSWTYATAAWRSANASDANRVGILVALEEETLEIFIMVSYSYSTTATALVGIAEDATNTNNCADTDDGVSAVTSSPAVGVAVASPGRLCKIPSLGYHFYQWTENAFNGATATFYSKSGVLRQSGLIGSWFY